MDFSSINSSHNSGYALDAALMVKINSPNSNGEQQIKPDKHLQAEQNRRSSLKTGFEGLQQLIVGLPEKSPNGTTKISKAALLQKAGDHLKELKENLATANLEEISHKQSIMKLKEDLKLVLNSLTEIEGSQRAAKRQRIDVEDLKLKFKSHIKDATVNYNWKYLIYSKLMIPHLESFSQIVSNGDKEELKRSFCLWIEQNFNSERSRVAIAEALLDVAKDIMPSKESKMLMQASIETVIETNHTKSIPGQIGKPK